MFIKPKKDHIPIKCMYIWMYALPYCVTAPIHQWMDMWMHVHGISKI